MERLNPRYLRPITDAEKLYEEVKELIEANQTLEPPVARLVIEKADDALKEFGNTNQEKKVELREWKSFLVVLIPVAFYIWGLMPSAPAPTTTEQLQNPNPIQSPSLHGATRYRRNQLLM
jgi:hypothetical protein